jgi:hypothetical protein
MMADIAPASRPQPPSADTAARPLPSDPPLASRASYEQGGWSDGRLGQAFDLIDSVLREHDDCIGDVRVSLRQARSAVENADGALEDMKAEGPSE